jgi:hypothetical protein
MQGVGGIKDLFPPKHNAVRKIVSLENRSWKKVIFVKQTDKTSSAELCLNCLAKRRLHFE